MNGNRLFMLVLCIFMIGCAAPPKSFLQVNEPGRMSVEIREDLTYDEAWDKMIVILAKSYDLEFASRDIGYIRTAWCHTSEMVYLADYRVRISLLFERKTHMLSVRSEAQFRKDEDEWAIGVDNRVISTLKTDILGTISRVTK